MILLDLKLKKMLYKCAKLKCNKADKCWRKQSPTRPEQKLFNPVLSENGECPYFFDWNIVVKENDIQPKTRERRRKTQ